MSEAFIAFAANIVNASDATAIAFVVNELNTTSTAPTARGVSIVLVAFA